MKQKKKQENRMSNSLKKLKRIGLRATPQRVAIMDFLDGNISHPSAEQIYQALKPNMPSLSLGTVYNTLDELVRKKVVQELAIDPTRKHIDPNPEPHSHFLCQNCGKIYDVSNPFEPKKFSEESNGFIIKAFAVYLYGLCPDCQKDNSV